MRVKRERCGAVNDFPSRGREQGDDTSNRKRRWEAKPERQTDGENKESQEDLQEEQTDEAVDDEEEQIDDGEPEGGADRREAERGIAEGSDSGRVSWVDADIWMSSTRRPLRKHDTHSLRMAPRSPRIRLAQQRAAQLEVERARFPSFSW